MKRSNQESGKIPTQDNHFLYYEKHGQGEPIIVLHGGPGLSSAYLAQPLLELSQTHSLIFYDQRGSGKSSGKIDEKSMNVAQFVKDLEEVQHFLGLKQIILLGHSWGALLAMHYAIKYPNSVSKLILLNSLPAQVDHNEPDIYREMIAKIISTKGMSQNNLCDIYKNTFKLFFIDPTKLDQLNLLMTDEEVYNSAKIHQFFEHSYDIRSQLTSFKTPTLIIHGSQHDIPLSAAENLEALIPNSKLQVLETGHFPFIEAPSALLAAIRDFLTDKPKNRITTN